MNENDLEQWAVWLRAQGHAYNTVRLRVGTVRRCALAGGVDPADLTTDHMVRFLDRRLAAWTRSVYVTSLRMWGTWLTRTGRWEANAALDLPRPKTPRGVPRPVSEGDLPRLIEMAEPRVRAMIVLAAYAGLRTSEVANIRGEDVTEEHVYVEGKGGVRAMIPTHPLVWETALRMPRHGHWFPARPPYDGAMRTRSVGKLITYAMRAAEVAGTPHHLRHRFGTGVLRSSGGNLRVAQELLRHANPATTAMYTKVEDVEKLAAVLGLVA